MTGLRITRARAWEVGGLARILGACLDEARWLPRVRTPQEERLLLARLLRRGEVWVARRGARLIGFLALEAGEVQGLYLHPDWQGQGVARALLAHVKTREARLGLWAHAANARARRFYAAEGFRPVAFGADNDERMTEIRYEWERAA